MAARTTLLVRCSQKEAAAIREHARLQRRTLSGYVLNIVMRAAEFDEAFSIRVGGIKRVGRETPEPHNAPRTAVLLCCSTEEANRIRAVARKHRATISGLILHCLRRSWQISSTLRSQPLNPRPRTRGSGHSHL